MVIKEKIIKNDVNGFINHEIKKRLTKPLQKLAKQINAKTIHDSSLSKSGKIIRNSRNMKKKYEIDLKQNFQTSA